MGTEILLEFLVVFAVAVLPHILASIFILTNKDYWAHARYWQDVVAGVSLSLTKFLLLGYMCARLPQGVAAIGLSVDPGRWLPTILACLLTPAYLSLTFVLERMRSSEAQEKREALRQHVFEVGRFAGYKSAPMRGLFLLNLWLGVIAEELVFRGYFVLGLGARTGEMWLWILISVSLSVLIHLYQGLSRQLVLFHLFIAAVFIAVSLLTGNILAAVVAHLVYNTIWVIKGWLIDDRRPVDGALPAKG